MGIKLSTAGVASLADLDITGFTQGSILFVGAAAVTEDNENLFYDATNRFARIGGNLILQEADDSRSFNFVTDPVLRIYSADQGSATDYLEFYHDQTDAKIDWGAGDLTLVNTAAGDINVTGGSLVIDNNKSLQGLTTGAVARDLFRMDDGNNIIVGNQESTPAHALSFVAGTQKQIQFKAGASGTAHLFVNGTTAQLGNIGIGEATSANQLAKLTVGGNVNITTTGDTRADAGLADNSLTVWSADGAGASDYLRLYHDQTDAVIDVGSGDLNFLIAGSEKMTLNSSGYLGIGKAAPVCPIDIDMAFGAGNHVIDMRNSVNGHILRLGDDITGPFYDQRNGFSHRFMLAGVTTVSLHDTTGMVFNVGGIDIDTQIKALTTANALFVQGSDGFVGVGTGAPNSLLDVRGAAGADGRLTLSTAETTVVDGNILGQIDFQAPLEASGTDAILVGASIWAEADDTFAADNNATELVFATAASETATEKMRLDQTGQLGIGTSTPTVMLEVAGDIGTNSKIQHNGDTDTHIAFFDDRMKLTVGIQEMIDARENVATQDYINIGTTASADIDVYLDNGSVVVEGSSSNVGIGTGIGASPSSIFHVDSNAADTTAIVTIENTGGDFQIFRDDASPESVITGSIGDLCVDTTGGSLYIKNTGSATNTGWALVSPPTFKSYTLADPGTSGTYYLGGYYDAPVTDSTLTIGGTVTQTHGGANVSYAAHAFCVASGAGGTDLVLTVSGTSITDGGTRTAADSEIIVADTDAASTDEYFETTKKWIGTITYTLTGAAGAFTFNYGFCKYEDFGNRDFNVTDLECVGVAGANSSGFDILLLHHSSTGWTYSAGAFDPGGTVITDMNTVHNTEVDVDNDDPFAFKRTGLSTSVTGSSIEGVIIKIATGANNAVSYMDAHIGITLK